jgi:hypothetical protein
VKQVASSEWSASGQAKTVTIQACDAGESDSVTTAVHALMAALKEMQKSGGADCATADHVKAALASLSKSHPQMIRIAVGDCDTACDATATKVALTAAGDCSSTCDTTAKAALASKSDCSSSCTESAKTVALASTSDCSSTCDTTAKAALASKSDCSSSCTESAKNVSLASTGDCSSTCDMTAKAALASKSDCSSSCETATTASFVAFDCGTCDRVVRAAAEAYVKIIMETQSATGASGCPMDVARKALASAIEDVQSRRMAEAKQAETVSLGVVGSTCSEPCSSSKASCDKN